MQPQPSPVSIDSTTCDCAPQPAAACGQPLVRFAGELDRLARAVADGVRSGDELLVLSSAVAVRPLIDALVAAATASLETKGFYDHRGAAVPDDRPGVYL